jgi:hypothetical protein
MRTHTGSAGIVSLDDYRRSRGERRGAHAHRQTAPAIQPAPALWVYWVPVWVW